MSYDLPAARKRFDAAQKFEEKQQGRELEDLSVYEGEGIWPSDIRTLREGSPAAGGLPAVPARPMITINKVREPVRHVINELRASDLGVEVVAADDFHELTGQTIGKEEIDLREGIIRRIQRESHAIDARIWAAERAVIAGRGYYGVMTDYVSGKTNDQDITIRRIYNQGGVLLDSASEQPDGSDASEAWVGTWMGLEAYRREHPHRAGGKKNSAVGVGEDEFQTLAEQRAGWFSKQGDVQLVRVVENWVYDLTTRGLAQLADGRVEWDDQVQGSDRDRISDVREVVQRAVKFYKLDGFNDDKSPLEETDWLGQYIPIIKVVGEEMQPYDQQRRAEGMVRPATDSLRGFCYMVSKWVEMIGMTPVPPLMMPFAAVEGFTSQYETMATRNWPVLYYNAFDPLTGKDLPAPARPPVSTDIAAVAGSVQMFSEAIKSTTAMPDATLGNVDPTVRSGRGIQALALNALKATAHFGDNFQRSVSYEGKILNDLLYPVFGRRSGRTARMVTAERGVKSVRITMPGQPMPALPPQMGQQNGQPQQPEPVYTLTPDAAFNVAIKVTRNYDTLREQEASTVMEAIGQAPEFMLPLVGDLAFKYQDGPGHNELAERMKFGLRPDVQAKLDGQQGPPPQVQALMQENQQLKQLLQSKQAEVQMKGQIDLQKTQMQEQAEMQRAALDQDTRIRVAGIAANAGIAEADIKAQNADLDRRLRMIELLLTANQEARLDAEQKHHDGATMALEHAHEANMAKMGHAAAQVMQAQQSDTDGDGA